MLFHLYSNNKNNHIRKGHEAAASGPGRLLYKRNLIKSYTWSQTHMLNQGDAGKYSMQTKIIKVVKKKI